MMQKEERECSRRGERGGLRRREGKAGNGVRGRNKGGRGENGNTHATCLLIQEQKATRKRGGGGGKIWGRESVKRTKKIGN